MKYDIQFVVPICLVEHYKKRFKFFKQNGLFNIKNRKVLVTLLCETNDKKCLENWPIDVDVELIHCPHNQESSKIYHYYSTLPRNHLVDIRWHAKIDDDSLTDVDDLLNNLDDYGDSEREFYFAAEILKNIEPEEENLCRKFGLSKWFEKQVDGPYVAHEVEGSFISRKAMQKIYDNKESVKFLEERAAIRSGYTDIALACAARLCKIYPLDTTFLTSESLIGDLSLFGGKLSHVHFVAPDINNGVCKFFSRMLKNNHTEINLQYQNKKFILQENQQNICKLQLMPNHKIAILSHVKNAPPPYDWTLWNINKDNLYFIGWDGSPICKFKCAENKLKGTRLEENTESLLKEIE